MSFMKSFWGFWTLVAIAVILIAVATAVGVTFAIHLGPESKAFVDETVPKIVKSWDVQDLVDLASPDLLEAISRDEMDKVFEASAKRLGRLRTYTGSWQESADIRLFDPRQSHATFLYMTEAVFERGGATIGIQVKKRYGLRALLGRDTDWRVTSFTVRPRTVIGGDVEPTKPHPRPAPTDTPPGSADAAPKPVAPGSAESAPKATPRPAQADATAHTSEPVAKPAPLPAQTDATPRPAETVAKPAPAPPPTDAAPGIGESSPAPARR
jgi:hypothetical protein